MRCLLLAFSLGVVMLQQQASLPSPWHAVYALLLFVVATGIAVYSRRAVGARRRIARGEASSPRHHFAFAYALTLGLVLVRFVRAIRPN